MKRSCPVSAWNSGAHLPSGSGYGLRLGEYRDEMIDRSLKSVFLELAGGSTIEASISTAFWRKCPELRHPEIGRWFQLLGLKRWPKGSPHRFTMTALASNRFRVTYP